MTRTDAGAAAGAAPDAQASTAAGAAPDTQASAAAGEAGTAARTEQAGRDWAAEVRRLAAQRDAVILAHNYQAPEIQDVADHVGDSLGLSRLAAASTASVIVFAGVYFMAETAKILAPDRTVLIPDSRAGCSLADTITAEQVREWKAEHPGAAVVAYVNTSAEVKAESDLCCTSANAAQIVASLPADREVLFLPDQFLGAYVQRVTGRANLHIWLGECHVHAGISPAELRRKASADAQAELFIHPECGCSTAALWQAGEGDLPAGRTRVLSTGGMLAAARTTTAPTVLVATETGMLHQLRRANPAVRWEPVNADAVCRYMKMTTPAALLRCLREGVEEVNVAPERGRPGPAGGPGDDHGGGLARAGRGEGPVTGSSSRPGDQWLSDRHGDRRGVAPAAPVAAALGPRHGRGGAGLRGRRPHRRADRGQPRPPRAAAQQGRDRRGRHAAGPGRPGRRHRSGGHPGAASAGHARRGRGPVRSGGRGGAGRRGARARSPGWPPAGPGWSAPRCTWRAGTAAAGSSVPEATRSARRCTGCCAPPCWPAGSRS